MRYVVSAEDLVTLLNLAGKLMVPDELGELMQRVGTAPDLVAEQSGRETPGEPHGTFPPAKPE